MTSRVLLPISCLICGATDFATLYNEVRGYAIVQCTKCRFILATPQPSEEELARFYSEDYGVARRAPAVGIHVDKRLFRRGQFIAEIMRQHHQRAHRVAEIGCSSGYGLYVLRQMGYDVKGFEISEPLVRIGRNDLHLNIATRSLPEPDERFDAIVLRHVLEHLRNPDLCLDALHRNLMPGGILIIAVPNIRSWSAVLCGKYWDWMDPPLHLSYFCQDTLAALVNAHGYDVQDTFTKRGDHMNLYLTCLYGLVLKTRTRDLIKPAFGGLNTTGKGAGDIVRRMVVRWTDVLHYLTYPAWWAARRSGRAEELWVVARRV